MQSILTAAYSTSMASTGLIMRCGGLRLYRRLRPAFVGLILGE
jgi:hypothetical protein